MTPNQTTELARLRAKLAAREGRSGFKQNCDAIRQAIAELENEQTDGGR